MDEEQLSYWERRKTQRMWEYMQSAEDTADDISKAYWKASGYVNNELDKIYDRFKVKHGLSNVEAKRLLNLMQDKSSFEELHRLLKQADTKEKKELLKLIEAPAYSARIRRLQSLQKEIDVMMHKQYKLEKERSTRHYVSLAEDTYYKAIFDIQKDTGLAFSFSRISPGQIDKVLQSKWYGENYSQRIWNNTNDLARDIKEELLLNLITGRTDQEVSNIISNKFGTGAIVAHRLVRTESAYIVNEMEQQSYEECEVEQYIFVATLDIKTSEKCRALDTKKFAVKERQAGKNCPPMHPWCRSTTIAYLSGAVIKSLTRRARNPETGKLYKVPGDMNYKQWHEKYIASNSIPNAMDQSSKYDYKQFAKYSNIFNEREFESFESFIDMKYNNSEKWDEFKSSKQSAINAMSFEEMDGLKEKLGNQETRLWYKSKDESITSLIDTTLPLVTQARQAHELRNTYRTQARNLMSDQEMRKDLDEHHPNSTFESLVEYKQKKYGLSGDDVYKDIIRSSGTTNKKFDKLAGVKE